MLSTRVVKRTGEIADFDEERIRTAILKAVEAVGEEIPAEAVDRVVTSVTTEIDSRFADFFPNVENIQDLVEKHLVLAGYYEIAKGYILYREDRRQVREQARKRAIEDARLGKLTVQKRDGRTVLFSAKNVESSILRRAEDLADDIDTDLVVREVINNVYDGIGTVDISRALVMAAASFIERDPAYSQLAARMLLQLHYKEVFGVSVLDERFDSTYRESFLNETREGIANGSLDSRLGDYPLELMAASLKPERDGLFRYLGVQTLYDRYFLRNGDRRVEVPQGFWMRVAMGLAVDEVDRNERALEFYDLLSNLYYVPSTPTLFHAGTSHPQLSSCYLTTIEDDLDHIFKSLGQNAQLSKWSGGLGNDWSKIRGTGAAIKSTNVESQGVVPFLKIANDVTMAINRSGKRRGATCAYLETWHYDIEEFLDLRRNTGDERRRTHDMNTVELDSRPVHEAGSRRRVTGRCFSPDETPDLHDLYGASLRGALSRGLRARWPSEGEIRLCQARMPAVHALAQDADHALRDGAPLDHVQGRLQRPFASGPRAGVVHSSNLCTEITLNTSGDETAVCNLGSVNLARHIDRRPARSGGGSGARACARRSACSTT